MYPQSFPNFQISQIMLSHLGWGLLGNWEVCTRNHFTISQIVLSQMGWSLLGNWEICACNHFPISQFPKSCWPIWAGVCWEIGKLGSMYLQLPFPNFPNSAGPSGLGLFGKLGNIWKLGNWEVCTCNHFPISQFPK